MVCPPVRLGYNQQALASGLSFIYLDSQGIGTNGHNTVPSVSLKPATSTILPLSHQDSSCLCW